ncbi:choice-of-anchor Q domain-containing protein [Bacteroidota bacterium]
MKTLRYFIIISLCLISTSIFSQLNGTYTVGSIGDYLTINEVIDSLNTYGVSGPVVFELIDEEYSMNDDTINNITGANANNTITIKPASNITPIITISDITAMHGIMLNETNYFIIDGSNNNSDSRDLTFKFQSVQNSAQVFYLYAFSSCQYNEIENCNIIGNDNNQIGIGSNTYQDISYNKFENNHIYNLGSGIKIYGYDLASHATSNEISHNLIGHNNFDSTVAAIGIGIYYQDSCIVIGNEVFNITSATGAQRYGIYVNENSNLIISSNYIHDITQPSSVLSFSTAGIYASYTNNATNTIIENNMISHIAGDPGGASVETDRPCGIIIYYSQTPNANDIKIYNNSIYLIPDDTSSLNADGDYSVGLLAYGSSSFIDLRNNIIQNSLGKKNGSVATNTIGYAVYTGTNQPFSTTDNNIFYVNNHDNNYMGFASSTQHATLTDWQDYFYFDLNSQFQDPNFISQTDLHIQPGLAIEGEKITSVTRDIDDEPRLYNHIGADEQVSVSVINGYTITLDTLWDDEVIQINGDITIADGATLTIASGTYIEFQGHYEIIVDGAIQAFGTEDDTIVFTINDTTGFSNIDNTLGGWYGIRFDIVSEASNDSSIFEYCKFEYSKAASISANRYGGALFVYGIHEFRISNCLLKNNKANRDGGAICFQSSNNSIIESCVFYGNTTGQSGGAIYNLGGSSTIFSSKICNNIASLFGGGLMSSGGNTKLVNCLIANNSNISNDGGGWVSSASSNDTLINNTIAYNHCVGSNAGGIFNNSSVYLYNNIIAQNTNSLGPSNFENDAGSAYFYNCNVDDIEPPTATTWDFSIVADPLFISPPAGAGNAYDGLNANFSLQSTSPCINAGDSTFTIDSIGSPYDLSGGIRIFNDTVDIGAYEYRNMFIDDTLTGTTIWDADTVFVTWFLWVANGDTLIINPGTVVAVYDYNTSAAEIQIKIDGTLIVNGQPNDSVKFIPYDNTSYWGGIFFDQQGSGKSIINYASIDKGNGDPTQEGAVYAYKVNVEINNSSFYGGNEGSSEHIRLDSTNSIIRNCYFNLTLSQGIKFENNDSSIVNSCYFENDYGLMAGYVPLYIDSSSVLIDSCIFINNDPEYVFINSADVYLGYNDTSIIQNSYFNQMSPIVFNMLNGGLFVEKNKFYNPEYVLDVYDGNGDVYFINNEVFYPSSKEVTSYPVNNNGLVDMLIESNTVFSNNATIGFFFSNGGGHAEFFNNIIWGFSNFADTVNSTYNATYNCLSDVTETGMGNVDSYPNFMDTTDSNFDLSLNSNSMIINRGTPDTTGMRLPVSDLMNNPRVFSGNTPIIDIGAYEFQGEPTALYVMDTIKANTTWNVDTVYVMDSLWIANGVTLTIEQGIVVVIFDYVTSGGFVIPIIVNGEILVNGVLGDSVQFIPYNSGSYWGGIYFAPDANLTSVIDYTIFDIGYGYPSTGGTVYADNVSIAVNNSGFYGGNGNLSFHINLHHTGSSIDSCYFDISNNYGILIEDGDSSIITSCELEIKTGGTGYRGLTINSGSIIVDSCSFFDNNFGNTSFIAGFSNVGDTSHIMNSKIDGMGISFDDLSGTLYFKNNKFYNPDGLLETWAGTGDMYFINNEVYYPSSVPVKSYQSIIYGGNIYMYNNSIYAGNDGGNSFSYLQGGYIEFKNNIIWGFSDAVFNNGGAYSATYNCLSDASEDSTGNIYVYPIFIDTTDDGSIDLSVTELSICINAGKPDFTVDSIGTDVDLNDNPRISGTAIDIGAYEYQLIPTNITSSPSDVELCSQTSDAVFTVSATGTALTYQWQESTDGGTTFVNIPGEILTNLTIINPDLSYNLHQYICIVDGDNTIPTPSDTAILVVNPVPDKTITVNDYSICENQPVIISLLSSEIGVEYNLYQVTGDVFIDGPFAGTGSFININLNPVATNNYYITAEYTATSCSDTLTDYPTVTVNQLPDNSLAVSNDTICEGQQAIVTVSATETNVEYRLNRTSDNLTVQGPLSGNGSDQDFLFSPLTTTSYYVATINTITSCRDTLIDTAQVVVNPLPFSAGAITGTSNICAGSSGISYSVGIIIDATSHTWSYSGTGATISGSTESITIDFAANATSGDLTVQGTNACGNGTISANYPVTINPLPTAAGTITGTSAVCAGSSGISYSVGSITDATSYTWSYSGTGATISGTTNSITIDFAANATSGDLTVQGTNACGNGTISANYPITINPLPVAAGAITGTSAVCAGSSGISYTVGAITNATSYTWSYSGTGATISGSSNSVTIDFAANATAGDLTVQGTNACGNGTISANYPITINPLPVPTITGSINVIQNQSENYITNSGMLSFDWTISGGNITSGNNTENIFATWTDLGEGSLSVSVTDINACSSFTTILVNVTELVPGAIQKIQLSKGWNIISLNVQPPSINMIDIIQPLIDSNKLVKVMDEAGNAIVYILDSWNNGIGTFSASEGYRVKVNADDSLTISGFNFENAIEILLTTGWNIISYPEKTIQPAQDVLADLIYKKSLVKAQNETGASMENIAPIGWVNNLENFVPGEGYKLKVNQFTSITYSDNLLKSAISSDLYMDSKHTHFTPVWNGNGFDHMNLYSKDIQINNFDIQPGDEIGVFDGELCVGVVKFEAYINGLIPLIASKDDPTTDKLDGYTDGNQIIFKVWDDSEQEEIIKPEVNFNENYPSVFTELGTSIFALKATSVTTNVNPDLIISTFLGDAYPNPFTKETNINYSLSDESKVVICVFNLLGEKVITIVDNTLPAGNYQYLWNRMDDKGIQAPTGIYLYRMETDGYTQTKQLIIQ